MLIPSPFSGPPVPVASNTGILNRSIHKPPPPNAHVQAPQSTPVSMLGGTLTGKLAGPVQQGVRYLPRAIEG